MTAAAQIPTETVRVHETPYVIRVEIDLPDDNPQMLFAITSRGLEIRVFRSVDDPLSGGETRRP